MTTFAILFLIIYLLLCYANQEKITTLFQYGYCIFLGSISLLDTGFNILIPLSGATFLITHWLLAFKVKQLRGEIAPWLIAQCKILPGLVLIFYIFEGVSKVEMLKWLSVNMFLAAVLSLLFIWLFENFRGHKHSNNLD